MLAGIHGPAGCGKTTAEEELLSMGAKTNAFARPLKQVCQILYGLTEQELNDPILKQQAIPRLGNVTPRYILQQFGTELIRKHHETALPRLPYKSLWVDLGLEWLRQHSDGIRVLTDCRFPDEISAVQRCGGYILGIYRNKTSNESTHSSEQTHYELCDGVILNNGTISEFKQQINNLFSEDETIRAMTRMNARIVRNQLIHLVMD